jgi:alkylhydroperoxidase family enzyme
MARIRPLDYEEVPPDVQRQYDEQIASHGRMTNMKRTLAHSGAALHALMEWYPLRDEVKPFLGERATLLFAHAISAQTDCLICSTFFRRILTDSGENPDELKLDDREQTLVDYGRKLAVDPWGVDDALFERLSQILTPSQIVSLTAFGAMMVATNIVNNALRVDLDGYLEPYRKRSPSPHD